MPGRCPQRFEAPRCLLGENGVAFVAPAEPSVELTFGFGDNPPNAQEMDRTKLSFLNQVEKTLANHEQLGVQLSEYIALGDWRLFFLARDDLEKVTSEKVAAASKAYFRRDNRTVGVFVPEDKPQRAEIPAPPPVAEVMKDFVAKAATSQAEAFDPVATLIVVDHVGMPLAAETSANLPCPWL